MNKLNQITLFATECPKCESINPEKTINAEFGEWERQKREAMKCHSCGYDIYQHNQLELEEILGL